MHTGSTQAPMHARLQPYAPRDHELRHIRTKPTVQIAKPANSGRYMSRKTVRKSFFPSGGKFLRR